MSDTPTLVHWYAPGPTKRNRADDSALLAVRNTGATAVWRSLRNGVDALYLVQCQDSAGHQELSAAVERALFGAGEDWPRVEVFAPHDELSGDHEDALLRATLLWTAEEHPPVRVARTFDSTPPSGPSFSQYRELVVDAEERLLLLDFLGAGELVLPVPAPLDDIVGRGRGAVPANLRSDGVWVWSEAAHHYLDRHRVAPDHELAAHAAVAPVVRVLTHLDRYRVRAALSRGLPEETLGRVASPQVGAAVGVGVGGGGGRPVDAREGRVE